MKFIKKGSFSTNVFCALICLCGLWILWSVTHMDFIVRQWAYENVLRQVKAAKLPVGSEKEWTMGFTGTLTPILPTSYPTNQSGIVSARRDSNGYIVSIITKDKGHFGKSGYIFSDTPLSMMQDESWGKMVANTPKNQLWFPDCQLNKNWWTVYENLD